MTVDASLIFAAGFGTRMGALTANTPKPMIKVGDRHLIDFAVDLVRDMKTIVVNTHYFPEQVEQHLEPFENITTLRESPEILETGGGLKNALPLLGPEPVVTLNSDAVWTGANPITALQRAWDPEKMDALLMLIPIENAMEHRGKGDFALDTENRLSRRGDAPAAPYVYSGAQIIKTEKLSEIGDTCFSLNVLWDDMLKNQRAFGIVHDGGWVDVGRPEGISIAQELLNRDV